MSHQEFVRRLYRQHRYYLYRCALHLTRCPHGAADLVQDTFVKALIKIHFVRAAVNHKHYLLRTLTRIYFAQQRLYNNQQLTCGSMSNYPSAEPPPGTSLSAQERAAYLKKIVSRLTPLDQQILDDFYHQRHTVKDIAKNRGVPLGTVKRRLYDARHHLLEMIPAREVAGLDLT